MQIFENLFVYTGQNPFASLKFSWKYNSKFLQLPLISVFSQILNIVSKSSLQSF